MKKIFKKEKNSRDFNPGLTKSVSVLLLLLTLQLGLIFASTLDARAEEPSDKEGERAVAFEPGWTFWELGGNFYANINQDKQQFNLRFSFGGLITSDLMPGIEVVGGQYLGDKLHLRSNAWLKWFILPEKYLAPYLKTDMGLYYAQSEAFQLLMGAGSGIQAFLSQDMAIYSEVEINWLKWLNNQNIQVNFWFGLIFLLERY